MRQHFPLNFFLSDHGKDLYVKIARLKTRDNLFPLSFFLFRLFFTLIVVYQKTLYKKSIYLEILFGRREQSDYSKRMMKKLHANKFAVTRGPPLIRVQLPYSLSHLDIYNGDSHFTHQTV